MLFCCDCCCCWHQCSVYHGRNRGRGIGRQRRRQRNRIVTEKAFQPTQQPQPQRPQRHTRDKHTHTHRERESERTTTSIQLLPAQDNQKEDTNTTQAREQPQRVHRKDAPWVIPPLHPLLRQPHRRRSRLLRTRSSHRLTTSTFATRTSANSRRDQYKRQSYPSCCQTETLRRHRFDCRDDHRKLPCG